MPKKILLADDSITIQKVIGLTFANEDVELVVVDNGDEAIIKAKESTPDLIIADVVMPGKDGYEVCYSVKNDPNLKHVPVLLLTGTFETFDETMAKKVGADDYITKPFESQALIDKVNELIGNAQPRGGPSVADLETIAADEAASEEFEPVEPLDEFTPIDDFAPLELDDVQAVEDNPLEEFAELEPDPSETSFADVSLDDTTPPQPAASAAIDSFDVSPADEPVPQFGELNLDQEDDLSPTPPPAPALGLDDLAGPSIGLDDDLAAPSIGIDDDLAAPSTGVDDLAMPSIGIGDDFAAPAVGLGADLAEPAANVADDFAEPALGIGDDLGAPAVGIGDTMTEPAATPLPVEPVAEEPAPVSQPIVAAAPAAPAASAGDWDISEFNDYMAAEAQAPAAAAAPEPAAPATPPAAPTPPAAFDAPISPASDALAAEPASFDELESVDVEQPMTLEADADLPTETIEEFDDLPTEVVATDEDLPVETLDEEFAIEEDLPVEAELDDLPAEPEPDDLPAEPEAEAPRMGLEQVADMYPLEESQPAHAAAQDLGGAALDPAAMAQLQQLPELIEARVRAALGNDELFQSLGDRASKLIEGKIEEAIARVAPTVIEDMVKKALAAATERILNETIGKLRG